MDPQLKKRRLQTVTYLSYIAPSDGYHEAQFAEPVSLPCYVNQQLSFLRTIEGTNYGKSFRYSTMLILDGLLDIDSNDKIIFRGKDYVPIFSSQLPGLKPGTGTTVVYL